MALPHDTITSDDAIQRYLAGQPVEKIETDTGVSRGFIYKELKRRGIPAARKFRTDIDPDQIVKLYLAGASVNAIAQEFAVSRSVVQKKILAAGIELRSRSQAGVLRASRQTPNERRAQVTAANRAARNNSPTMLKKFRNALTREANGTPGSPGEQLLLDRLNHAGMQPMTQRAIGPYNVDISVTPVAVEILGGGWHAHKSVHTERTPYILDEGWHLLFVWNHEGISTLTAEGADKVVMLIDELRRNPAATCQYRVVSGNGELLTACGRESNEFPLVPPPRSAL